VTHPGEGTNLPFHPCAVYHEQRQHQVARVQMMLAHQCPKRGGAAEATRAFGWGTLGSRLEWVGQAESVVDHVSREVDSQYSTPVCTEAQEWVGPATGVRKSTGELTGAGPQPSSGTHARDPEGCLIRLGCYYLS